MGHRKPGNGWKTSHGYRAVSLGKAGTRQYEHRVIWEKHFGPIPPNHVIHHKNGDGTDNRLENLELLSKAQHQQHHAPEIRAGLLRSGKSYKPKGELHHMAKFTNADVRSIRARCAAGETVTAIAREFEVWPAAISRIKNGTRWPHLLVPAPNETRDAEGTVGATVPAGPSRPGQGLN